MSQTTAVAADSTEFTSHDEHATDALSSVRSDLMRTALQPYTHTASSPAVMRILSALGGHSQENNRRVVDWGNPSYGNYMHRFDRQWGNNTGWTTVRRNVLTGSQAGSFATTTASPATRDNRSYNERRIDSMTEDGIDRMRRTVDWRNTTYGSLLNFAATARDNESYRERQIANYERDMNGILESRTANNERDIRMLELRTGGRVDGGHLHPQPQPQPEHAPGWRLSSSHPLSELYALDILPMPPGYNARTSAPSNNRPVPFIYNDTDSIFVSSPRQGHYSNRDIAIRDNQTGEMRTNYESFPPHIGELTLLQIFNTMQSNAQFSQNPPLRKKASARAPQSPIVASLEYGANSIFDPFVPADTIECAVCYEAIPTQDIFAAKCKHECCRKCVTEIIKRHVDFLCPLCRCSSEALIKFGEVHKTATREFTQHRGTNYTHDRSVTICSHPYHVPGLIVGTMYKLNVWRDNGHISVLTDKGEHASHSYGQFRWTTVTIDTPFNWNWAVMSKTGKFQAVQNIAGEAWQSIDYGRTWHKSTQFWQTYDENRLICAKFDVTIEPFQSKFPEERECVVLPQPDGTLHLPNGTDSSDEDEDMRLIDNNTYNQLQIDAIEYMRLRAAYAQNENIPPTPDDID